MIWQTPQIILYCASSCLVAHCTELKIIDLPCVLRSSAQHYAAVRSIARRAVLFGQLYGARRLVRNSAVHFVFRQSRNASVDLQWCTTFGLGRVYIKECGGYHISSYRGGGEGRARGGGMGGPWRGILQ